MAQWVKCFLHKHEDLNLDPWYPHKKLGVVVWTCNPTLEDGDRKIPVACNWQF